MPAGNDLRYNQRMRILLLVCLLLAAPMVAWAEDAQRPETYCSSAELAQRVADDCCQIITIACIRAIYKPRCDWPEHKCAAPYVPCECGKCVEAPRHKPVTPYAPCGAYCLEPVCHKPVVAGYPTEACVCGH